MEGFKTMFMAASGLKAQASRMRIIAENMANSSSTAKGPDGDPYRRKIPVFSQVLDRELGANMVKMERAVFDKSEFGKKHEPNHPAADEEGYIRTPNVNGLVETMDMREAMRSYEANLNMIQSTRTMLTKTLDLLRR